MSDSQEQPWSNNPNAPKISYKLYFDEKAYFAGTLIDSILYGIVVALFFRCITGLLNPIHRRGKGVKWGLVSYTAVMFSLATVLTGMSLDLQSSCYIDNRDFSGVEDTMPPGPFGYQLSIAPKALNVTPGVMFTLSNWLADGLLLYRCYVIYFKNTRVIAFPCLMYLGSVVMGIMLADQNAEVVHGTWSGLAYLSISLLLNVLLTLMIIIRLILHARNTRAVLGITGSGGMYKAIVTMLVESCALYTVSSLLVIGPGSVGGIPITNFFIPVLTQTQVIAPLLVIQRVANNSALTSNTVASGCISEFGVRSRRELSGGSDTLPGEDPVSSVDRRGVGSGEFGVRTSIDIHREKI